MISSKYKNVITEIDGIKFDSKKEAKYYGYLKMRKLAGEIEDFIRQVEFKLIVKGDHICSYVADFIITRKDGERTLYEQVIDVKSEITRKNRSYRIKVKLMKACFGVDIFEA